MTSQNLKAELSPLALRVECRIGHRGESLPARFFLGGRAIEILDIVDRWVGHDQRYFKVQGDDRDVYILRHDNHKHEWELTLFSREDYWAAPVKPLPTHSKRQI